MPEGHTIHRIARDHGRLLAGRTVRVSSPQGRFAADAERVDGAVLERIQPYGKHLFYEWSTGEVGHVHLGLFGKYRVQRTAESPEPIGQVRMRLQTEPDDERDEYVTVDLAGPTACIDRSAIGPTRDPRPSRPRPDPSWIEARRHDRTHPAELPRHRRPVDGPVRRRRNRQRVSSRGTVRHRHPSATAGHGLRRRRSSRRCGPLRRACSARG